MFRQSLSENEGMIFLFQDDSNKTFWTKDTYISLDIIFLDSKFKIVSYYTNTLPNQTKVVYDSKFRSQFVIETKNGFLNKNSLKVGDILDIRYQ